MARLRLLIYPYYEVTRGHVLTVVYIKEHVPLIGPIVSSSFVKNHRDEANFSSDTHYSLRASLESPGPRGPYLPWLGSVTAMLRSQQTGVSTLVFSG